MADVSCPAPGGRAGCRRRGFLRGWPGWKEWSPGLDMGHRRVTAATGGLQETDPDWGRGASGRQAAAAGPGYGTADVRSRLVGRESLSPPATSRVTPDPGPSRLPKGGTGIQGSEFPEEQEEAGCRGRGRVCSSPARAAARGCRVTEEGRSDGWEVFLCPVPNTVIHFSINITKTVQLCDYPHSIDSEAEA